MKDKFIKKFNNKDSILTISSYPRKKQRYSQGVCAVASFAKNTLLQIQRQNPNKKIVVLTMKLGKREEIYEEDGILVVRCIERNNPLSYFRTLSFVKRFNHIKSVLLEFEFASFGDLISTASLSFLVWAIFFLRKDVNLVVHQVLLNLDELSGHIGIDRQSLKMKFLNVALRYFYKFLTLPAKKVIVLEDKLKNRLGKIISGKKISVIPHGVDNLIGDELDVKQARRILNLKQNEMVILYFGYLTWYKGVDFLIKALQKHSKINKQNIKLIVAGGPSFTQGTKTHYKKFLKKIYAFTSNISHIQITGFVSEEKIPLYFKAADLAILPYRKFMSSSGPFSMALSFKKPVLLSRNLAGLLRSTDIQETFMETGLTETDLTFSLTEKDLVNKIALIQNPRLHKKALLFSKILAEKRSFAVIANSYNNALEAPQKKSYSHRLAFSPSITK